MSSRCFTDSQHSRVTPLGNGWQFEFSITISREAAERFAKVTTHLTTEFSNGQNYLSSDIDLYLDNGLVDSLKISSDLKGKEQPDIQISGPGSSRDECAKEDEFAAVDIAVRRVAYGNRGRTDEIRFRRLLARSSCA